MNFRAPCSAARPGTRTRACRATRCAYGRRERPEVFHILGGSVFGRTNGCVLIDLGQQRVAVFLEPLIVLLAEAQALHWPATDRARTARPMLFDVAGSTDTLQVLFRVVRPIPILVMHIESIGRPTPLAIPRGYQRPRPLVACCIPDYWRVP